MARDLKDQKKVVGQKQSKRAIQEGIAKYCYIASDASDKVTEPVLSGCVEMNVEVDRSYTMSQLGEMCGIDVGASVVVLL